MCIADRSLSRLRGSPLPGAGCWGHLTCVWLVHPARCVRLGSLSHGGTCPLPATAPGRSNVPTRDDGQAPGPIPSGTANPKAHRRHSRRSCIQLDKRTHARHRPISQSNPKRHSQPKCAPAAKPPQLHPVGQTHLRETQTNRPAQTQAAQPTPKRPGGEAAAAATGWINAAVQD